MFVLIFTSTVFSQSITNTLGIGGVFTIKDASNTYFTLTQSTGQVNILKTLRLENTTSSTTGIIFKGTTRFIHNYYPATSYNTFIGMFAGNFTLTGANYNTGIGYSSLSSLINGSRNTALGYQSLSSNTSGNYNTALGYGSLKSNIDGDYNTAFGHASLNDNTTGYKNTAGGYASLFSNTVGYFNTALGYYSLYYNTAGYSNTALGNESLKDNTTGNYNTALGTFSLTNNTDGDRSTALGYQSLSSNTTGNYNTAVGYYSLVSNIDGFRNTGLGYFAGSTITTGSNLTCLGYNAEPTSGSATNQITLGNSSVTSLRCNVTTITALSDARDKKNITDLSVGLDFLMKVKPRLFNWDKREWYDNNVSDGSKMKKTPTAGFIAQELDEVQTTENAEWLNLVLKDNPEKFEATYGNLLPVMVKAIQDLKIENDKLTVESEKLKVESAQLWYENKEMKQNNQKLLTEVESLKSMNEKIVRLEQIVNELNSIKHTSLNGNNVNMTILK